jgi:hypothetical protein
VESRPAPLITRRGKGVRRAGLPLESAAWLVRAVEETSPRMRQSAWPRRDTGHLKGRRFRTREDERRANRAAGAPDRIRPPPSLVPSFRPPFPLSRATILPVTTRILYVVPDGQDISPEDAVIPPVGSRISYYPLAPGIQDMAHYTVASIASELRTYPSQKTVQITYVHLEEWKPDGRR